MVTGLCAHGADPPAILLSPRNAQVAANLASRFPSVVICDSNQDLVDRCTILVIAVRPRDAADILKGLRFPRERQIVSVMVGLSVADVAALTAPAANIVRALPLPAVARREGVTAIQPPGPAAAGLFGRLGGFLEVTDAAAYDAYIETVSTWLERHGIPKDGAHRFVGGMFANLAASLLSEDKNFQELSREHATRGGVNELMVQTLTNAGVFDQVSLGLDAVLRRIVGAGDAPITSGDRPRRARRTRHS
jgi:pyrroline-5-carboxylate reductase